MTRLGVIADTHGLMRPEALAALRASDLIIHAGDIGEPEVLISLRAIAPVVAVRGNNDRAAWARRLPESRTLRVGAIRVHVVHDVKDLAVDLERAQIRLVVSGHSHRPSIRDDQGVLFVNPGSAGPQGSGRSAFDSDPDAKREGIALRERPARLRQSDGAL
jgi:putative phosphoesterase